jgi:hypothetical protein
MKKITPIYDDTIENQLSVLICKLDENPILCTTPVEESSYLHFKLYTGEEGFQQQIEVYYDNFIAYLNSFIKDCSRTGTTQELLLPTLARIFTYYKHAKYKVTHSTLRIEWKNYSHYFVIPNPKDDYNIEKQQKYTRWAYSFFHTASSIQLYFINQVLKDLAILIKANTIGKESILKNEPLDENETKKIKTTPPFHFKVLPSASKHSYDILFNIHKNLKQGGYIECALPEFRQVFMSKKPRPIIWLKPYSHLSYFIYGMTRVFLKDIRNPSNNQVALNCFYNLKYGRRFKVKRIGYDGHYKPFHDLIDNIINDSIKSYTGNRLIK